LLLMLGAFGGCSTAPERCESCTLRILLTGQTMPESPYRRYSPRIKNLMLAIDQQNPDLVIHLGNIIYGGKHETGVIREDVNRQYDELRYYLRMVRMPMYLVSGTLDVFEGDLDAARNLFDGRGWYSFNYGDIHLVVLNTSAPHPGTLSHAQLKWLEENLRRHRSSGQVIVFMHHAPFVPGPGDWGTGGVREEDAQQLHNLLVAYPVRAVISGDGSRYFDFTRDEIRYINAGCDVLFNPAAARNYYMLEVDSSTLTLTPGKL
jgi:3',5'-cyclic AMP phosphodiesterase CpdA